MATPMVNAVCKGILKVSKYVDAIPSQTLLRQSPFATDLSRHRGLHSYCQSSGAEPDKLYKKLEIEVKGHDTAVMNSYEQFVRMTAKELDVTITKVTTPPRSIKRWTLLKSVHIYAKHKVQYEARTHFRVIEMKHVTGSTADTLLEFIERNLPEGMAMKVTRHAIEVLPEHLKPPVSSAATATTTASAGEH